MPETPDLETTARLLTDPVGRQRVVEKLLPLSEAQVASVAAEA